MIKAPRGTRDILPDESCLWQKVEAVAREVFSLYGYEEIRTPCLEEEKLFRRSLGDSSEVVDKQMFIIKRDRGVFCLRPEGTASVIRAYLEHNLSQKTSMAKLYYTGPMFRAERPQKGRLREFHHLGAEVFGSSSPYVDGEIVCLLTHFLGRLGVSGYTLLINSLGCPKDKIQFSKWLHKRLEAERSRLCPDCIRRMDRNVFRILDCKKAMCKKVVSGLGLENMSSLCPECSEHFNEVTGMLQEMRIAYQHQATLVRGLDYYTRTVFEFIHPELGSQDAFCAGGRYDHLIEALGGPSIPGVGFALGLERLLLLQTGITGSPCGLKVWVYVATLGDAAQRHGFKLLEQLRQYGIPSETDYLNRSLKAQMREASRLQAKEVIILGDNELARKTAVLRNMGLSSQQEVDFESLPNLVRSHYEQGV